MYDFTAEKYLIRACTECGLEDKHTIAIGKIVMPKKQATLMPSMPTLSRELSIFTQMKNCNTPSQMKKRKTLTSMIVTMIWALTPIWVATQGTVNQSPKRGE